MPEKAWDLLARTIDGEPVSAKMATELGVPKQRLQAWTKHPTFIANLIAETGSSARLRGEAVRIMAALGKTATGTSGNSVAAAKEWRSYADAVVRGGLAGLFQVEKPVDTDDLTDLSDDELRALLSSQGM